MQRVLGFAEFRTTYLGWRRSDGARAPQRSTAALQLRYPVRSAEEEVLLEMLFSLAFFFERRP